MTLQFTILGCGSSGGVPRPALGWGACDPEQSEEPPPAHARSWSSGAPAPACTRVLVDTSPDLREQLLDAEVDWLDARAVHPRARRPHPRHRRPARAVHQPPQARVESTSTSATSQIMHARFGYCFDGAARQRISADRARASPGGLPGRHDRRGRAARSPPCPSSRSTATSPRSASASAAWPIPATSAACRPTSVAALAGLEVWIIDALRDTAAPEPFQRRRGARTGSSASSPRARS